MPDDITPAVFRLPVEIEVADAKSSRTEQIEITQRAQSFTFSLDGEPRMIRFDKDSRLLKTLDFPQSTKMLSYQLTHSADAIGRIEAAEALAHTATKQVSLGEEKNPVVEALQQALTTDSFYGVRVAAANTLARLSHEDHAAEALVAGAADKDSRVRAAVIGALKDSANLKAIEAVRGALNDPSPFVIVAAMAGALKQGDDAARIAVAEIASRQNVAPRVLITAMLSLASLQRAEALPLAMKAVKADQSMEVRRAGLRALYRIGTHDPKAIERLISLLDDSERDIRYAAIQILGELKATSAAGALLRLSKEDRQADVRKAATAALAQLNKPSNEKASAAIDAEPRSTDVP
jgi:aminopeptidase N